MRRLTLILLLAVPPSCLGWGRDGHKIIAQIAADRLTPEARNGIAALLEEQSLPDASIWADEIRRDPAYRWSAPFHYANVEPGTTGFDLKRDCPEQGCVVSAVIRYAEVLRDPKAEQTKKVEALKFLVHFVGDVHNPMHVAYARDRGGNDVAVEFFYNRMNLHRVWDSGLLDRTKKPWSDYAAELGQAITPERAARWKGFDPAAWATESYKLAVSHAYAIPKDGQLGQEYFDRCIPVVDERLSQAGVRLADILNDVLRSARGPATATAPAIESRPAPTTEPVGAVDAK
jgi:hypothetical protein